MRGGRRRDGDIPTAQGPVRTCIGCRQRASATDLLRVVAGLSALDESGSPVRPVLADPRARAAGRGAWVHPTPDCVRLAERRRAFGRALRCDVRLDPAALRQYVESAGHRASGALAD